MPHVVDVDQSGRVEFTGEDTVLAFSNGIQFAVLIPSVVKRECVKALRDRGFGGTTFYPQFFTVGLYYLLKDHLKELARITIDLEYFGKDEQIKEHLINLLRRANYEVDPEVIQFGQIGKHSDAHRLAIAALRKKIQPNLVLTREEILGQFKDRAK
jgi:hypothetical protein